VYAWRASRRCPPLAVVNIVHNGAATAGGGAANPFDIKRLCRRRATQRELKQLAILTNPERGHVAPLAGAATGREGWCHEKSEGSGCDPALGGWLVVLYWTRGQARAKSVM